MNETELKQRTKAFALRILKLVDSLPNRISARVLANQIARSGTSVAANYRSACRGRCKAEFIAKLGIAEEEADETELWLELIEEHGLLSAQKLGDLRREAGELTAILAASRITASARPASRRQSAIHNRQSAMP
jgi:four helix bundle protein